MRNNLSIRLLVIIYFILFPSVASADGLVVRGFYSSGRLSWDMLGLLIMIIVIETIILKILAWHISWKRHLVVSAIANIVSGVAGLVLAFVKIVSIILVFIATIVVEFPVLLYFYKRVLTIKRVVVSALVINIVSYGALLGLPLGMFMMSYQFGHILDNRVDKTWNDVQLLEQEHGFIYTIDPQADETGSFTFNLLTRYNLKTKQWKTLRIQFKGSVFSTSAGKVAFVDESNISGSKIKIVSLVNSLPEEAIINTTSAVVDLKLDPTGRYLAIFTRASDQFDDIFNPSKKLSFYDIKTKQEIGSFNYTFGGDGSWSPDSTRFAFSALHDGRKISDQELSDDREWEKERNNDVKIYSYNINDRSIEILGEGMKPQWSPNGSHILFKKGNYELYMAEISTKQKSHIMTIGSYSSYYWLPSGRNIIVNLPYYQILPERSRLVVLNINNPKERLIIRPDIDIDMFDWSSK